jgi:Ca2+:H+ antiporter
MSDHVDSCFCRCGEFRFARPPILSIGLTFDESPPRQIRGLERGSGGWSWISTRLRESRPIDANETSPRMRQLDVHSDPARTSQSMILNLLLIFVPVAIVLDWMQAPPHWTFATAGLAVIPLAALTGRLTDELCEHLGSTVGSLASSTLGNLPDMMIGILALSKGLPEVVKSSLAGSIIGNLLFSLGVAMCAGGLRRPVLKFNPVGAGVTSSLLLIATIGLLVPAIFRATTPSQSHQLSVEIAATLFCVYLLSIVFTLVTHRRLFSSGAAPERTPGKEKPIVPTLLLLALTAVALAGVSDALTGSLEPATDALHLTPMFAGMIVLANLGNVSTIANAVTFARQDKMDLAFGITVGASMQSALLVAPLLVFSSYLIGQPMDLLFEPFELASMIFAVIVAGQVTRDGEAYWIEGVMLIGVYAMISVGVFFMPSS